MIIAYYRNIIALKAYSAWTISGLYLFKGVFWIMVSTARKIAARMYKGTCLKAGFHHLQPIHKDKQDQPDHINKMPVPSHSLKTKMKNQFSALGWTIDLTL